MPGDDGEAGAGGSDGPVATQHVVVGAAQQESRAARPQRDVLLEQRSARLDPKSRADDVGCGIDAQHVLALGRVERVPQSKSRDGLTGHVRRQLYGMTADLECGRRHATASIRMNDETPRIGVDLHAMARRAGHRPAEERVPGHIASGARRARDRCGGETQAVVAHDGIEARHDQASAEDVVDHVLGHHRHAPEHGQARGRRSRDGVVLHLQAIARGHDGAVDLCQGVPLDHRVVVVTGQMDADAARRVNFVRRDLQAGGSSAGEHRRGPARGHDPQVAHDDVAHARSDLDRV